MTPSHRDHLRGNIVVWLAHVSEASASLPLLGPCLDAHDRDRVARFHYPEDRARFTLGRALLRQCLSTFLEQPTESIELAYTERDRPYLPADRSIQFSLSHTHDLVALALTADAQIGIDLEFIRPYPDLADMAERIFSPVDLQIFQTLSAEAALDAFFRVWTRKEAYLKARGEGISEGLQEISVSLGPEEISSIRDRRDPTGTVDWRLLSLPVPSGYRGCLACDHTGKNLQFQRAGVDNGKVILDSGLG